MTIDHVKECAAVEQGLPSTDKFNDDGLNPVNDGPKWPASPKQMEYVLGLQRERRLPEYWVEYTRESLALLERDEVSGLITQLKAFTRKDSSKDQPEWTMPPGRYAILSDEDGWFFYQVDKPTEGRWKGYTFIVRLIGAPGDYRKVKMSPEGRRIALRLIEADPQKAMVDYGLHSGVCGVCSSPLSDPESLARGIGPICATKSGWF